MFKFKLNPISGQLDLVLDLTQGTEATILALTPIAGSIAWATDLKQFMMADGTNWYVNSGYMDINLQAPDMGHKQDSNRSGYHKDYITDKRISNSSFGSNAATVAGGVRYNATLLKLQGYLNSAWETIVSNLLLVEVAGVLEHTPIGYTNRIAVFSGNSDNLGLNGLPIIQGYKTSMGAYPVKAQIDGGTF